ncbi:MAG TPA: hypothetical protein PK079_12550 [Leptospiraceae bacterium]|nr:hypothetical protein [Leptospiraceae bacterium]HMW06904.1 hypothetical protein [Leptospiraceae bacterium]HMX32266.1 hypothetical protein [Leptospiraceae bacterium]HMY33434.1 hypothetical protein [Leptospiraceae bacterium]HMZ64050.1 hypothetical protein [Leptospiraceae bacterium]
MNFFRKKSKFYIHIESNDMRNSPEDLIGLFVELNSEINGDQQLIIRFIEVEDISMNLLNVVIPFLILMQKTHTYPVSIQAEPSLVRKFKEANLTTIVSRLENTRE